MTVATPEITVQQNDADAADTRKAMRGVTRLLGGYAGISALTLVAIVLLSGHPGLVNSAVWTRGSIAAGTSLLTLRFAVLAARGSSRFLLRLRIVSAVMVVAITAIIALPGTFPLWMKIDQGVCDALLIVVVALVNSRWVRARFAAE